MLLDTDRLKLAAVSSIVGGNPSRQSVTALSQDLKRHLELALPYMSEKSKMRQGQDKTKANDPAFWRKLLSNKNAELAAKDGKEEEPALIPLEPETID